MTLNATMCQIAGCSFGQVVQVYLSLCCALAGKALTTMTPAAFCRILECYQG